LLDRVIMRSISARREVGSDGDRVVEVHPARFVIEVQLEHHGHLHRAGRMHSQFRGREQ